MVHDFKTYFFGSVFTAYKQYCKTKKSVKADMFTDRRDGLASASALYHLREYLPINRSQSFASLAQKCPDYELLGDIVNVSKHNELTKKKQNALVQNSMAIYQSIDTTIYSDRKGQYTCREKNVVITLSDGSERILFDILTHVMNMWLNLLSNQGLIEFVKPILISDRIPARSRSKQKLNIQAMQGLKWPYAFRMFEFDHKAKIKKPITDYKMEMKLYPIEYTAMLTIKGKSGKQTTFEIPITEAQMKQCKRLNHENDRMNFLVQIGAEKGIFRKEFKDGKESIVVQVDFKD